MINFQLYFVFDGFKLPIGLLCMPSLFLSFIIYTYFFYEQRQQNLISHLKFDLKCFIQEVFYYQS